MHIAHTLLEHASGILFLDKIPITNLGKENG